MTFELSSIPPWIAATIALGTVLVGWLALVLRARISADFARKADFDRVHSDMGDIRSSVAGLDRRMGEVEQQMATMPSGDDVRALTGRVGAVEAGVAVVAAEQRGTNAMLAKMDRGLEMLLRLHLDNERRDGQP